VRNLLDNAVRCSPEGGAGAGSLDEAWSPGARFVLELPRAPVAGARR
jgi:hypothetical protein